MTEFLKYKLPATSHLLVNECEGSFSLKKSRRAALPRAFVQVLPNCQSNIPAEFCDGTPMDFVAVCGLPIKKKVLKPLES